MALKLISPPAVEPVSLDEAKAQCRVDIPDDDAFITSLIKEARTTVEDMAHRAFISQTWRLSLDSWPGGYDLSLPRAPLKAITSLIYLSEAGTPTTWAASNYIADTDREPGRLVLAYNKAWPGGSLYPVNPIQVTFVAGYGDAAADVPATWKRAIMLLIGHWYENRETTISGTIIKEIPLGVQSLVWLNRG